MDHLIIITRCLVLYGAVWIWLRRILRYKSLFELFVITVCMVQLVSYMSFLFFFWTKLYYTPLSSIVCYLLILNLLMMTIAKIVPKELPKELSKTTFESVYEKYIWIAGCFFYIIFYYLYGYRPGGSGAALHFILTIWQYNHQTQLAYPDISQIPYTHQGSVLWFHPVFVSTVMMINAGVKSVNNVVSGAALLHASGFIGIVCLVKMVSKRLLGSSRISFVVFFISMFMPTFAYSILFLLDYNSLIPFFVLAIFYYLLVTTDRAVNIDLVLLLIAIAGGINTRIWLAAPVLGACLVCGPIILWRKVKQKDVLSNSYFLVLCSSLSFITLYWTFFVYGLGNREHTYGVYQGYLEWHGRYGTSDLSTYYSLKRLIFGFKDIVCSGSQSILGLFGNAWYKKIMPSSTISYPSFLAGHISFIAVIGAILYAIRQCKRRRTWVLLLSMCSAVYVTAFVGLPEYLRIYFWVIPVVILFAVLGLEQAISLIPFLRNGRGRWLFIGGLFLALYLNFCGFLYVTHGRNIVHRLIHVYPTFGMNNFFGRLDSLNVVRKNLVRVAAAVNKVKPKGSKTLHLVPEPGLDLCTFMGDIWWNNYMYYHGPGEDMFRESGFDERACASALLEHNISIIDVPSSWDAMEQKAWSKDGLKGLRMIHRWIETYPAAFVKIEVPNRVGPWHTVYFIDPDKLRDVFQL